MRFVISIVLLVFSLPGFGQLTINRTASTQYSSIAGKLIGKGSDTFPNANVALFRGGQMLYQGKTNSESFFQIDSVPIGEYILGITYPGYENKSIPTTIRPDARTSLPEIIMNPMPINLEVETTNGANSPVKIVRKLSTNKPVVGSTIEISIEIDKRDKKQQKLIVNEYVPEGFGIAVIDTGIAKVSIKDNHIKFKFKKLDREAQILRIIYVVTIPTSAKGKFSITGNIVSVKQYGIAGFAPYLGDQYLAGDWTINTQKSTFVVRQGVKLIPGKE